MTQFVDEPLESLSPRGNFLMPIGSVIGLMSAVGLAWDGRVCGDVLHDALTARNLSGIVTLGQRLVRIGWCPLGVALGGTFVWFGLRRAARQSGLSPACVALVALYGLLAVLGAFAVWEGTGNLRAAFFVVARSETAVKAEQIALATTEAVVPLSHGWILLAVAHVALLAGGIAQIVSRPRSASPSAQWPKTATVALILLWLFGAIVSTGWIRYGLAFQQYATVREVKASLVADQISGVLSSGWYGCWLLMGHALTTVFAGIAAFATAQRSSSHSPHEVH